MSASIFKVPLEARSGQVFSWWCNPLFPCTLPNARGVRRLLRNKKRP